MKSSNLIAIFVALLAFEKSTAFTIHCNFGSVNLYIIGDVYRCYTTNIPQSSGETVTAVTGTHLTGKTNNDVDSIRIYGNWTLSFFLRGVSNFFPNIKTVSIYHTAIETLTGDELDEFPQLEYFRFYQSNLTTVPSALFQKTSNLAVARFAYNKLERVGFDLFTPVNVTQLKFVSFTENPCISQEANNQSSIISLIDELRVKCPFNDENNSTTTTTVDTTVRTTVDTTVATTVGLHCSDENIEELVCYLSDEMSKVQNDLTQTREDIRVTNDDLQNLRVDLDQTKDDLLEANQLLKEELTQTREELQNQLQVKDEKIELIKTELEAMSEDLEAKSEELESLKSLVKWLEMEVLRMTSNPCACK